MLLLHCEQPEESPRVSIKHSKVRIFITRSFLRNEESIRHKRVTCIPSCWLVHAHTRLCYCNFWIVSLLSQVLFCTISLQLSFPQVACNYCEWTLYYFLIGSEYKPYCFEVLYTGERLSKLIYICLVSHPNHLFLMRIPVISTSKQESLRY